uniref:Apple domain-containing protein n=1 Tax=Steinernema glaseri TaxID=37863 RepID=A0A1I7YET0_9BILA
MPSMVVELQRSDASTALLRRHYSPSSSTRFLVPLMVLCYRRLLSLLVSTKISRTSFVLFLVLTPVRANSGKCFYFGPGTTIDGADYRRDYDVSRRECAEFCKVDVCCMGFEWVGGMCTLKSRSLNGTIVAKEGSYFGLCLDFDEIERDRFWDHELSGPVIVSAENVEREECIQFCSSHPEQATIFSWRSSNYRDVDEPRGHCNCIGVLHSVRLQFGSFAGFVLRS